MKRYIVNITPDNKGDHEVHELTCHKLPSPENQKDLGHHLGCYSAVLKAKTATVLQTDVIIAAGNVIPHKATVRRKPILSPSFFRIPSFLLPFL